MAEQKYQISATRVKEIIKEEWDRKLKQLNLQKRLKLVNEEIQKLEEDDLDEVTAGGETTTTSPDGLTHDAKKWKPEFEKKGSHLKEEKEEEEEEDIDSIEVNDDLQAEDLPAEEDPADNENLEDLDLDQLMSMVADKIHDEIADAVQAEKADEEAEEAAEEDGEAAEEGGAPEEIEVTDAEETPAEGDETDIEVTQEQKGDPIVNKQEPKNATPFDNGKKDVPAEPEKSTDAGSLNEDAKKDGLVITEGTKLYEEVERMRQLAGFSKKKLVD